MKTLLLMLVVFITGSFCSWGQTTNSQPPIQVYIAASGDAEQLPAVLDGIADYLSDKGVSTKQISDAPKSRTAAIDELNEKHGKYLLFAKLDFAPGKQFRASLEIQARDASGKLLWTENTKGAVFMVTKSGYIKGLVENSCKKLDSHIGKEGLPKDDAVKPASE